MAYTMLIFLLDSNVATLLIVWFACTYHVPRRLREDVRCVEEEMRLHRDGQEQARGSAEEHAATAQHIVTFVHSADDAFFSSEIAEMIINSITLRTPAISN